MFIAYGPGITNPIALEKLFVKPAVAKVAKSAETKNIKQEDMPHHDSSSSAYRFERERARKVYQSEERTQSLQPTLKAAQIMTAPVVSLQGGTSAREALKILDERDFRHLPVLSSHKQLIGMISDRDIYRCMCGSDTFCLHCSSTKEDVFVENIMKDQVLAANIDTDARYIARLFVEQGIEAIPVVENDLLVGIVTRGDILRAVMQNFNLNIWE